MPVQEKIDQYAKYFGFRRLTSEHLNGLLERGSVYTRTYSVRPFRVTLVTVLVSVDSEDFTVAAHIEISDVGKTDLPRPRKQLEHSIDLSEAQSLAAAILEASVTGEAFKNQIERTFTEVAP